MEILKATRQALVQHLSLFLQLRRRKWMGLQALLQEAHLNRPTFFLLRALEGETVPGQILTVQQMQKDLFNPYSTQFTIFDHLPLLAEQGYLQRRDNGYLVTDAGRLLTNQIETAARIYIGLLDIAPSIPLAAVAMTLVEQVHRAWQSPEPLIKAHQARTQRRLSVEGAAALVQIEWAVLGLWEARDDAHMAVWRAHDFSGPTFDILTHIWSKEAQTLPSLIFTLEESQQDVDIQRGLGELTELGYVLFADDHYDMTQVGQKIRDNIEEETDRIFFASWEHMTNNEFIWLNEHLKNLCSYFRELP